MLCSPKKSYAILLQGQSICLSHLEFFYRDLSEPPHLLIQSYVYISMDSGYLFYTLGYNLVLLFIKIFTQIFPALAFGSSFNYLCVFWLYLYHCGYFYLFEWVISFLNTSLLFTLQDVPGSYCTFFPPCPRTAISSSSFVSFYWTMILDAMF